MNIHIAWEGISALCAVLTVLAALLTHYVRSVVREEIASLREDFIGAPVFEAYAEATRDRLELLERRYGA
jgi:hypothetical protein